MARAGARESPFFKASLRKRFVSFKRPLAYGQKKTPAPFCFPGRGLNFVTEIQ
jgi:hypothetical protein